MPAPCCAPCSSSATATGAARFPTTLIRTCSAPAPRGGRTARCGLMEDVPSVEALTAYGAEVINTTEPQLLLDGKVYVSGEIPRVTPFERGLPGQHRRTLDGTGWELDELDHGRALRCGERAGKGLIVFTACSHAGIVNVLKCAKATFGNMPLYGAVGGLHLSGSNETHYSRHGRGTARVRSQRYCGRSLHRLARDDGARQYVRRKQARSAGRRQTVHVLTLRRPSAPKATSPLRRDVALSTYSARMLSCLMSLP